MRVEIIELVFGSQCPDTTAHQVIVEATIDDVTIGKRVEDTVLEDVCGRRIAWRGSKAVRVADFESHRHESAAIHACVSCLIFVGFVGSEPWGIINRWLGLPKATRREQAKTDDRQNDSFEFVHCFICLILHLLSGVPTLD